MLGRLFEKDSSRACDVNKATEQDSSEIRQSGNNLPKMNATSSTKGDAKSNDTRAFRDSPVLYRSALQLCASHAIGQGDLEATLIIDSLDLKCGSASPRPSNLLVAIAIMFALSWAMLEYARLVLMLITYPEAVRSCYEQCCSVTHIKERPALCYDDQARNAEQADHHSYHLVPNDSISTNIPVTPPQLSDDLDRVKLESVHEGITTAPSICVCTEEDYLVAMEDDVRKPSCIATHELDQAQQHTAAGTESRKRFPTTPVGDIQPLVERSGDEVGKAEMEHHFKNDLPLAADRTTMDVL
ncbi:hypothetical protein PHSY_007507 [Pseudozyma hubeiensis SY62]|uniref:Uncharacterized protein n=1 Tax=Pseudozyma hubeiensis (strain SY62) TaxID=1305764 RepID=R9PEW0_PSEHS|nr:hypothetical protein PHSY_007507 [Pseudozyma hubeiensis SY62]GAC99904.1 hypothetical protein PHSY_007507 [Pseudozyma hubeiensis SY62]